jgi:hypothetical protein
LIGERKTGSVAPVNPHRIGTDGDVDVNVFAQMPFRNVQTPRADALRVWRTAAHLVSARWNRVLKAADPETREECYAAYIAALDVEAAAAAELAALSF